MRIRVQYYGHLRQLAGRGEESVELAAWPVSVGALRGALCEARPALAASLSSTAIAIGDAILPDAAALDRGVTVALLPPVSGG